MALILEIRDRRGHPTWHALDRLPLTIGRGLSNDIILDDPYVDATHARVWQDESGALVIEDLGSVNGIRSNGTRLGAATSVLPGTELRVGRTTLRFRDRSESVAPALAEGGGYRLPRAANWALTTRGGALLYWLVLVAVGLNTWLGNYERSPGSDVLTAVIVAIVMMSIWSLIWALSTRGPDRRVALLPHFVVISAATLTLLIYGFLNEWLTFLFPETNVFSLFYSFLMLSAVALVIVGHLAVGNVMTWRGRWRVGLGIAGVLLLFVLIGAAVGEEKFSDVPSFNGQLQPLRPALVPTTSVSDFVAAAADAKKEADEALDK